MRISCGIFLRWNSPDGTFSAGSGARATGLRRKGSRVTRPLESFARTQLLPYDFTLTDEQLSAMSAGVRFHLKATRDNELFAPEICVKLQKIVDAMIEPWRQEHFLKLEAESSRAEQNRTSALGHVAAFLNERATPGQIDALRTRFGIQDLKSSGSQAGN